MIINSEKYGNIKVEFSGFNAGTFTCTKFRGSFANDMFITYPSSRRLNVEIFNADLNSMLQEILKENKLDKLSKKDTATLEKQHVKMLEYIKEMESFHAIHAKINNAYLKKIDKVFK